jgi:hypothetical protein
VKPWGKIGIPHPTLPASEFIAGRAGRGLLGSLPGASPRAGKCRYTTNHNQPPLKNRDIEKHNELFF